MGEGESRGQTEEEGFDRVDKEGVEFGPIEEGELLCGDGEGGGEEGFEAFFEVVDVFSEVFEDG